jgi:hypothetical protein
MPPAFNLSQDQTLQLKSSPRLIGAAKLLDRLNNSVRYVFAYQIFLVRFLTDSAHTNCMVRLTFKELPSERQASRGRALYAGSKARQPFLAAIRVLSLCI